MILKVDPLICSGRKILLTAAFSSGTFGVSVEIVASLETCDPGATSRLCWHLSRELIWPACLCLLPEVQQKQTFVTESVCYGESHLDSWSSQRAGS